MQEIVVAVLFVLLISWIYKKIQKPRNFPPGPPRLPLLGSVPFLSGANFLQNTIDLKKKYGGIVGFYFGNSPVVIISDLAMAKEVFKKPEASGTPYYFPFCQCFPGWKEVGIHYPETVLNCYY